MEKRCVTSERGKTYYWVSKKAGAQALVFLHGLTADHRLFEKQFEFFKEHYTVIAWDAPAHGCSRPYADFSYAHMAEELNSILMSEGVESSVLIGQSMGVMAAQSFILRYPEKVTGLVSIDSCPISPKYYSKSDLFWLRQIEWMARCYPDKTLRVAMAKACGTTKYTQDKMLLMQDSYDKKELCHLMYLGEAGFIPEMQEVNIKCPVCLILGDKDKVGKVTQYTKLWQKNEGYPLHIIKDAAHNSNEDKPEEVNKIIEEFIKSI